MPEVKVLTYSLDSRRHLYGALLENHPVFIVWFAAQRMNLEMNYLFYSIHL